ncbi:F-box/LRR-repeat protein 12 isoform X3 [Melopsittacus undulatus]|uniref:F-box/LRR-repeat protein 12 isoform X3 n=1 Tax=Melopsittacus undulatus TaxID=13146 RepID=UPI00146AC36A|nr:F-box/LRR-repeat protein 12 isoform X3 [Melopsittacus undulatus]
MAAVRVEVSVLPDSVLLQILALLPPWDRLRAAGVCRRWRRLALDRAVWKHVDLSQRRGSPIPPLSAAQLRLPVAAAPPCAACRAEHPTGPWLPPVGLPAAPAVPSPAQRPGQALPTAAVPGAERDGSAPHPLRQRPCIPDGAGAAALRAAHLLVPSHGPIRDSASPPAPSRPCFRRLAPDGCLLPASAAGAEPAGHPSGDGGRVAAGGSAAEGAAAPGAVGLWCRRCHHGGHWEPHEAAAGAGGRGLPREQCRIGPSEEPAGPGEALPGAGGEGGSQGCDCLGSSPAPAPGAPDRGGLLGNG